MTETCTNPKRAEGVTLNGPQSRVLLAICDHIRERNISPTYEEIAERTGKSWSAERKQAASLVRLGLVKRAEGRYRNFIVTPSGHYHAGKARRVAA